MLKFIEKCLVFDLDGRKLYLPVQSKGNIRLDLLSEEDLAHFTKELIRINDDLANGDVDSESGEFLFTVWGMDWTAEDCSTCNRKADGTCSVED